jgi:manganese/zinc/iron transport system substrate-binding protein
LIVSQSCSWCRWLILGSIALVVACDSPTPAVATKSPPRQSVEPILVVATVGMVADLVREIGGSHVAVTQLMGPGVDPHLYKGTRDDVRAILAADVVFYSGLMLEGKLIDMLEKKPVVAITRSLDQASLFNEDEAGHHPDPHVWMDVSLWSSCVPVIVETLSEHDPAHAAEYRRAADRYQETLAALHAYGQKVVASVPEKGRVLITSHDAFHYFGRAYGLEVFGVQGMATDSEAGLEQINSLVDTIVTRKVAAVFVESSVPPKSIQAVVDGALSRKHRMVVGGELFSDAMGKASTYEGTYVGMLDHNLTMVARSLGGSAPTRGMQGKLAEIANSHE